MQDAFVTVARSIGCATAPTTLLMDWSPEGKK